MDGCVVFARVRLMCNPEPKGREEKTSVRKLHMPSNTKRTNIIEMTQKRRMLSATMEKNKNRKDPNVAKTEC